MCNCCKKFLQSAKIIAVILDVWVFKNNCTIVAQKLRAVFAHETTA